MMTHVFTSSMHRRKRRGIDSVCDTSEARLAAVYQRANEVQANLSPEFPSLIKCMLPSHVTGGFWLVKSHSFLHASAFSG